MKQNSVLVYQLKIHFNAFEHLWNISNKSDVIAGGTLALFVGVSLMTGVEIAFWVLKTLFKFMITRNKFSKKDTKYF